MCGLFFGGCQRTLFCGETMNDKYKDSEVPVENFRSIKDGTVWECEQCGHLNKFYEDKCAKCRYCPNCG